MTPPRPPFSALRRAVDDAAPDQRPALIAEIKALTERADRYRLERDAARQSATSDAGRAALFQALLSRLSDPGGAPAEPTDVVGALLERLLPLIEADQIALIRMPGMALDPRLNVRGGSSAALRSALSETASRGLLERVWRSGELLRSRDAQRDPALVGNETVQALALRAILCIPMPDLGRGSPGVLWVSRLTDTPFKEETVDLLILFGRAVARWLIQDALGRAPSSDPTAPYREGGAFAEIVGRSPALARILEEITLGITQGGPSLGFLLLGPTGVGKERIAQGIHAHPANPRRAGPFVAINCAAIPEPLLESTFFGHVKGAFTGADGAREGLFQAARGGTLFLDEVGDLSLAAQAALLRALEERRIRPVGGGAEVPVDVRVLAATSRPLREMMAAETFRADLYYRLAEMELDIPPLDARREDIEPLALHLLDAYRRESARPNLTLSVEAALALRERPFPGNVRELRHTLRRAALYARGEVITPDCLKGQAARPSPPAPPAPLKTRLAEVEARLIQAALREAGSVEGAAEALGISRPTLYRRIAEYGLEHGDAETPR